MTAILTILSSIASWALKTFGLAGCALILTVFYFEGVPLVSSIPYVNYIPGIGDIVIGRVQVRVNEAVSAAQHTYAVASANAAAKAKADAESESARQAAIVTTEYQNRLSAAQLTDAQSSKDLDNALAANEKLRAAAGIKSPPPSAAMAALLRKHGFQVDP